MKKLINHLAAIGVQILRVYIICFTLYIVGCILLTLDKCLIAKSMIIIGIGFTWCICECGLDCVFARKAHNK